MSRAVIWSEGALADLEASVAFIAETNVTFAAKLALAIRAAGDGLGVHDTGRPSRMPGYREKSVTDIGYILAYDVDRDRPGEINVVRVVHHRQDWSAGRWPTKPKPR